MTQPAQMRKLLTDAAERQRAQRDAMAQVSADIAAARVDSARTDGADQQQQK